MLKAFKFVSCACAMVALPIVAAVPTDGGLWTIGGGETETLDAAITISELKNNGTFTLGAGAELTVTGAVVNAVGYETGNTGKLTITGGASLVSQGTLTGDNPGNTQGFSIGTFGGTGEVTVASGGSLTVGGGRLYLGRNSMTDANSADRSRLSQGTLNIFGTVVVSTIECGAWFPQSVAAEYGTYVVDEFPIAAIFNLEEGGVLELGQFYRQDKSCSVFNFRGGTLRASRENNEWFYPGGALIWNIEEGKNLVIDTNGHHVRITKASVQPDFFQIRGAGGFVKKGAGYFQVCDYAEQNTFSGPIVVEEGDLSIGRPLLEGQTVYVHKGARFFPACADDVAKITYEDPSEAPQAGSVFAVQTRLYNDIDLTVEGSPYVADKLAGPIWGWGGEVHGVITHSGDISFEHPFELVGQNNTLNLYGTGLDALPLVVSGTGTFNFDGNRTDAVDNVITFTGSAAYRQSGTFSVQGENGEMPKVTISGGGSFTTTDELRAGYDGRDGEVVISGVPTVSTGNIRIGTNPSTRQPVKGKVTIENSTVTVPDYVGMSGNCLTDGSDLVTLVNELVLGPGAVLKTKRILRNDDPRGRVTFAGGTFVAMDTRGDTFANGQNGVLEIVPTAGNDVNINIGTNNATMLQNHTHVFGDGGFHVTGTQVHGTTPVPVFTLGAKGLSDFLLDYNGGTRVDDATLRLGVPLPPASTVTGTRGVLDLNGFTITNTVTGDVTVTGNGKLVVGVDGADGSFAVKVEDATLEKVGAGELSLDASFGGTLVVKEGTVTVRPVVFRSFRFKLEGCKSNADAVQLSELKLLDGGDDVTRPYASIGYDETAEDDATPYPAKENPSLLVDGTVDTKWLDWRILPSHPAADHERAWLQINYDAPKHITGYAWYTANDFDRRDPTAWRLQGSNDGGATWVDIDVQTGFTATTARKTLTGTFAVKGAFRRESQIIVEPDATLRVDGGSLSVASVENKGAIELVNGATLESAGGYVRGDVSGAGGFDAKGGEVTLIGEPTYSGATHVFSGTLNVGAPANPLPRPFDGKYFRLAIKRSNGGDSGGADIKHAATNFKLQASEFRLYSADGEVQSQGLTAAAVGIAAPSLAAGTFSCPKVYLYSGDNAVNNDEKLFDGNTGTKLCCLDVVNGSRDNWHIVTMRLRDDAKPIAAYNFLTANDFVRRSPTDWTLEGSRDGMAWELLDERHWAPHTTFTDRTKYNDSSIQYKPFNNGVNYQFETDVPTVFDGKFLRFTFKKTAGNTILQLSELCVFDISGKNVALGLAKGLDGSAAATLAPGSFCKGGSYAAGGGGSEDMDKLFDDDTHTKLCATSNDMKGDSANYRVLTMRLSADSLPVSGYLFVTANDSLERSPCDWKVEGSMDGVVWVNLDERAGIAQPYCLYTGMNAGHPYTFQSIAAAQVSSALPAGSEVTVDADATLNLNDEGATIKALKVDCTRGGGTINSFRAASGGRLELVNVPAEISSLEGYEVPITVNPAMSAGAIGGWKVVVDGKVSSSLKPKLQDGRIVLIGGSTVIFFR